MNAFCGTSTFPILDYRYLVTPSAGTFYSNQTGMSNIDIQRVEVVRGAASALYGPGVTSGVVHFMSKSPIDYPGTTVEMLGGTLSTTGMTVRHAFKNDNDKFGFKVNVRYMKGKDFELDKKKHNCLYCQVQGTHTHTHRKPNLTQTHKRNIRTSK